MATSKSKKYNQKYLIIAVGLALATAGYFGYKSMLTTPDINKISPPKRALPTTMPNKTPAPSKDPVDKNTVEKNTIKNNTINKNTTLPKYTVAPRSQ